jgi:hypothetical protein
MPEASVPDAPAPKYSAPPETVTAEAPSEGSASVTAFPGSATGVRVTAVGAATGAFSA